MPTTRTVSRFAPWIAVLTAAVATLLILRAELSYNQTFDETAHVACGMEWLSLHTYTYDLNDPPLPRIATALLPFLHGVRSQGHRSFQTEGTALLNWHSAYRENLMLARLGILPFFWLACFLLYRRLRSPFGEFCAVLGVALFAFCPPVLAHTSSATTDAAFAAMFLLSVLSFERFLAAPSLRTGASAGVCFALATMTKYTELPFFLVTACVLLVHRRLTGRKFSGLGGGLLVGGTLACLVIWAMFLFSVGPLYTPRTTDASKEAKLSELPASERAWLVQKKMPAPEFVRGIFGAFALGARLKPDSYLFGQTYTGGKWYFFPVCILVKTPIALLVMFALGLAVCLTGRMIRAPESALFLGGVLGPLAVCMASGINLGLRHALPVYPFLAMLGAVGVLRLWNMASIRPGLRHGLAAALVVWEVASCLWAAPEFLPYFNEAAMPFFGKVLVASDLDWGQDFYKLEHRLANVDPGQVSYVYFGDGSIVHHQSAAWKPLTPDQRATGWIAVSETEFQRHAAAYAWLAERPFERIGRSIRLYHVEP